MDSQSKTTVVESRGAPPKSAAKKDLAPTLYFIAIGKIMKGAALLLLGAGIFSLSRRDLPDIFDKFLQWVHLDPENHFFANIADWLSTITPGSIQVTALATSLYGMFLIAVGVGLAIRARWAIWLTIGESAFFIPIEIYKLVQRHSPIEPGDEPLPHHHLFPHPKIGLAVVLALNVLIVWYLLKNRQRLSRHHN